MEWINKLNKAIDYIEDNLDKEINIDKAAQIAVCQTFHFQRMFTYIAGVTLGEYIRRRKMTVAVFELINSNIKIIDLALKYGYDSPTSFNRAFQNVHNISPSNARKKGVILSAFPRITFTLSIKGDEAMNYKIEKKESFRIVGICTKEPMTMEDCFEKTSKFWEKAYSDNSIKKICELVDDSNPKGLLGVSICENGVFGGYFIAAATSKPVPEGMEEYIVPAGEWAVFECVGMLPDSIQNLQKRIISEWLPTSGYEYASAPDIEVYFDKNQSSETYRSQVWLPIVKK